MTYAFWDWIGEGNLSLGERVKTVMNCGPQYYVIQGSIQVDPVIETINHQGRFLIAKRVPVFPSLGLGPMPVAAGPLPLGAISFVERVLISFYFLKFVLVAFRPSYSACFSQKKLIWHWHVCVLFGVLLY